MSEKLVTIAPGHSSKKIILPENTQDGMLRSFKGSPIRTLQGLEHRVVIPVNQYGLRTSPLEAGTGMPLPILGARSKRDRDYHHKFFYEGLFNQDLATRAVRLSGMQLLGRWVHIRYHKEFDGTKLPDSDREAFRLTILGLAGYVPKIGIHLKEKEVVIRPLRNPERFSFRKPDAFKVQQETSQDESDLLNFIEDHAANENFDAMKMLELEEFMDNFYADSSDQDVRDRQLQLAFRLTASVLSSAVEVEKPRALVAEGVA